MNERKNKSLVWAWLWVAGVVGYMLWSMLSFTGLYRSLAEMQIARWNKYYEFATLGIPLLALAGPALSWIRREKMAGARVGGVPDKAAAMRSLARTLFVIGVVFALASFATWKYSQSLPDGSEPAEPIDLAAIAQGQIPITKIALKGKVLPDISVTVGEKSRTIDINTTYVGFLPEGAAANEPVRVFVERYIGASANLGTTQAFMPQQTGYLVANGLPPLAILDLKRRGVALASPVYLLRPGSVARREPFYIVASLCGLMGFTTFAVGGIVLFQRRNVIAAR